MQILLILPRILRGLMLFGVMAAVSACAPFEGEQRPGGLDPEFVSKAVTIATDMDRRGQRVWCVPFARNASGIEIYGNARTWWKQAEGRYERGHTPKVGAVMAFSGSKRLPLGHVAVVSKVISDREILVHHANWKRNKVSLDMSVIDISEKNDWSLVRVKSQPTAYGRPYKVDGFISKPASRV